MDSDKIIQHKILELAYNQYIDFSTQKSPDKHLGIQIILDKLKVIYPEINITIVATQCFRLSAKGYIEPIETIKEVFCTITKSGEYAYRSQLLIEENTKEENEDKYVRASILASIATKDLSAHQKNINVFNIGVAIVTVALLLSQLWLGSEMKDLQHRQLEIDSISLYKSEPTKIEFEKSTLDFLGKKDTVYISNYPNNFNGLKETKPKH